MFDVTAFTVTICVLGIPFYMSVILATIIKALFLLREGWTITPAIMLAGSLSSIYPVAIMFNYMLNKLAEVI